MPQKVRVDGVNTLSAGEARSFTYTRGGESQDGFVLRHAEGFVAYRNWCPHWGVDLDMGAGKFYARKVDRIYCRNHGALFRVLDGYCDAGPCATQRLERFEVEIEGSVALVTIPDFSPELFD